MRQKVFTELFGYLYRKRIFRFVIAGLVLFGVCSWFYFRSAIEANIDYRLNSELERLTSEINDKFGSYALTLNYMHSYFRTHGVPAPAEFSALVNGIGDERLRHGIQGLGYVELVRVPRLSAPVRMVEPMNPLRSRALGTDLLSDPSRRASILAAVSSGRMTLAPPRLPGKPGDPDRQLTVSLMLAYYGKRDLPPTPERLSAARGVLYIPIRLPDFFEGALGPPDRRRENVNFTLSSFDEAGRENPAYRRFSEIPGHGAQTRSQIIDLYGRRWKISVDTMPGFFSFTDRYLAFVVAVAFLLFSALLLVIFYQTQNLLEHETRIKKAMEDTDRMKTAFLSNMSHEIRTPLNAITGFSEILAHTDGAADKRTLLQSIRRNSSELTGIIDNMLDISRLEFGKIHIHHDNICFASVIGPVRDIITPRASDKHLNFRIESAGLLPTDIQVDATRVRQILLNLLGNAVKFTEKGGLRLRVTSEISDAGTAYLLFDVIDSGIGIPEAKQAGLFQSFSQLDFSNTRRFGGMGLGLDLSRRLAQQLGGDVTLLESRPGKGSVFRLKIPCGVLPDTTWKENLFTAPPTAGGGTETLGPAFVAPAGPGLKGKRIMVVEDSEDNQDIFEYFLKTAGALPDVIGNGEEAVQKANQDEYDLILMDVQLPKMDGLEATRRIRTLGYRKPIIALTAHVSAEEKDACLQAGCIDLIAKPVTQEILIHRILSVLEETPYDIKN